MRQRRAYSEGDYLVRCDRSGQKALRSDCVKEWDGSIVIREYSETRHPLDHPAPPMPEAVPLDTRPPGDDQFLAVPFELTIGTHVSTSSVGYNALGTGYGALSDTTYAGKTVLRVIQTVDGHVIVIIEQSEANELAQDFWVSLGISGTGGVVTLASADADIFLGSEEDRASWRFNDVDLDWANHLGAVQYLTFNALTASSLG